MTTHLFHFNLKVELTFSSILELRKKTRTSTWKKPNTDHVHEYGQAEYNEEQGVYVYHVSGVTHIIALITQFYRFT
jgi:hypothetical protein